MAKNSRARRILTDGEDGADALFRRISNTLEELNPGEDLRGYVARRDEIVAERVAEISALMTGFDGFDIVELMRQREIPFTLTGYQESQSDGMAAFIEVAALVLLARGTRSSLESESTETPPNHVIDQLHSLASAILTVGTISVLAEGEKNKYGPLTRLAAEYRISELNVRGKQYNHIHDELNRELFGADSLDGLLGKSVGFEFGDFVKVRDVIGDVYIEKLSDARDQFYAGSAGLR